MSLDLHSLFDKDTEKRLPNPVKQLRFAPVMRKNDWRQLSLPLISPPKVANVPLVRPDPLPSPPDPDAPETLEAHRMRIAGYLTMRMSDPVMLTFTDNRSTMLSFRRNRGRINVRLHRMFRHADTSMLGHLASYLSGKQKTAAAAIDAFIAEHREEIDRTRRRRVARLPEGRYFNLDEVLARVSERYFGGPQQVTICWGPAPRRRRRGRRYGTFSRALATYHYDDRMIRVSPVLDAPNVPAFVIDWIVYHELLHHVLPVVRSGTKNIYHSAKFRALERAFEHYEKAKAWEEKHMAQLLK